MAKQIWQTNDGNVFATKEEALAHEKEYGLRHELITLYGSVRGDFAEVIRDNWPAVKAIMEDGMSCVDALAHQKRLMAEAETTGGEPGSTVETPAVLAAEPVEDIPEGVYWFADHSEFYNAKGDYPHGDNDGGSYNKYQEFRKKWLPRASEFPVYNYD